jgi:kumamolisin
MMWNTQKRLFQLIRERHILVSLSILFLLLAATFGAAVMHNHTPALASGPYVSLPGSFTTVPGDAHEIGSYTSAVPLAVSVVLQPTDAAGLRNLLAELYNPDSPQYHKWLAKGQFDALFAPSASEVAQATSFLQQAGLTVSHTSTPFILRAIGTTARMQVAFHTRINSYKAADGQLFFQNASAMQVPASLASQIMSVVGLSSTVRLHPHYITTLSVARRTGKVAPRYGAGPGGSGLTPAQVASLYGANGVYALGSQGQGRGRTLAVFELSGYTPEDIKIYEQEFFGRSEDVPLQEIDVDGGPVHPICPEGDECGPFTASGPCVNGCDSADYSGDIEVEADVERQIATAPALKSILIYNAPNDMQGLTILDEYFKIANDDQADAISSGWGLCEQDAGSGFAQAESIPMEQLAAQGQSMFAAAGDTGAYDCLHGSGNTALAVDNPASQPFVTAVGGTSFEAFDPGSNQHPVYPGHTETVWNVQNLCSGTPSGLKNCAAQGAGGGGASTFWGMPSYQAMPPYQHDSDGIISSYSQKGRYCGQNSSLYCREVPDVSANADEHTPYAEYCTGNPKTNSNCATFSSSLTPPGWFGIGGTSLSSPLWSGIIALWDSVHGARFGCANYGLYALFRSKDAYSLYYHDITGEGQKENNNGYYPTTPYYDMATGIGSPNITAIAEADIREANL